MTKLLFYKTEEFISTQYAYNEMCNLIKNHLNELFLDGREINNCRKEIFPIIVLANFLKYKEIQFVGAKGKSIDAILRNNENDSLNVECTTSIDFRTKEIVSEYNKLYGACSISPRTKAVNIEKEEINNNSDIVYKGSCHNRVFEKQNSTSFEECIIDNNLIKQYAEQDIKQINKKIEKGIKDNCYKNFLLLLSIEHVLNKEQLPYYCKILYDYWKNISENPFNNLFLVMYDCCIFYEYYKEKNYNPSLMPVPILSI